MVVDGAQGGGPASGTAQWLLTRSLVTRSAQDLDPGPSLRRPCTRQRAADVAPETQTGLEPPSCCTSREEANWAQQGRIRSTFTIVSLFIPGGTSRCARRGQRGPARSLTPEENSP